jgi:hypothetical protein
MSIAGGLLTLIVSAASQKSAEKPPIEGNAPPQSRKFLTRRHSQSARFGFRPTLFNQFA